jgi:hypothetical protein
MRDAIESGFLIVAGVAVATIGWAVGRINRIGHRIDHDRHAAADHRIIHELEHREGR